jgi:hypothetical protein
MARRKSPWQQFADNFDSVYGTFNKFGSAMETRGIMNEKPEEEIIQEGPRNSYERATGKWNYGGKTYDKEITPDMLRGLQYNRLGDVMAKYGDPTGAMDMRTKAAGIKTSAATLEAQNLANTLKKETLDFEIEQADLKTKAMGTDVEILEQKLVEMIKTMPLDLAQKELAIYGYEIDNNRNLVKLKVETAIADDTIELAGIKVEAAKIANINETIKGEGWQINNDGNLVQLGVDTQTADSKVQLAGLKVDAQLQENINAALEGTGLVLNNRGKLVAAETAEALQDSDVTAKKEENLAKLEKAKAESTAARLENNANLNLIEYSEIVKDGGNFTNKDGQKISNVEWLEQNWTGDPKAKKLINTLRGDELTGILREGVVMMTSVEAAITGKTSLAAVKDELTKLIDDQDSIPGNVTIEQGEGGAVWLIEKDAEGNKTSEVKGKDFEEFKQNLLKTMSPMRAVSIATANAQLRKVEAQVAELTKVGMTLEDAEKEWIAYFREQSKAGKQYHGKELDAEEIATLKYNFFNEVIAKAKTDSSGLNGDDSKYKIQVLD